jgi:hypothetical protein
MLGSPPVAKKYPRFPVMYNGTRIIAPYKL